MFDNTIPHYMVLGEDSGREFEDFQKFSTERELIDYVKKHNLALLGIEHFEFPCDVFFKLTV